jgi:hypothetical protein
MTAPARVGGPAGRTRTRAQPRTQPARTQPRERTTTGKPPAQPEGTTGTRGRSSAAERAYARRAQRTGQTAAVAPVPQAERRPGSASRATFVVSVMVLLVGGVVATLWFSTQATADAYRLEQAKNTTNQLQVQVGQLQQEVARQGSPQSLAQRARQLGMIPAPEAAHLVVGANGKVSVVGTPSVAQPPPPPPKPTTTAAKPTTTPPASKARSTTSTSTPPTTTANPSAGG